MKLTRRGAAKVGIFLTSALAAVLLAFVPTALGATGLTTSSSASAHDNVADVTCTTATISAKNYDKNATIKVTLDTVVKIDGTIPSAGYTLNEALDPTINHTLTVTIRSADGAQYNLDFSKTTTDCKPVIAPPTQTVTCDAISVDYHRPLTNGDHINATITPPGGQVNMYVDQNVAGGASYNGQNNLGLRWKILGVEQIPPIPLTLAEVKAGIIAFSYAASLTQPSWTIPFVQSNETDTWPNLECSGKTKKDAAATVSVTAAATCDAATTVEFGLENAIWDAPADTTPGVNKSRKATSLPGHVFPEPNGTTHASVSYTIEAANPSLCPKGVVHSNPSKSVNNDTCGVVQITFTNIMTLKEGEVGENAEFTYTDKDGATQSVSVVPNTTVVKTVTFDEGTGNKTVLVGVKGEKQESFTVPTDCMASPPLIITPEVPVLHDSCGITDDSYSVPGTPGEAITSVNNKTGDTATYVEYTGDLGKYKVNDNTTHGIRTVTFTFVADPKLDAVINGRATWSYTFDSEPCTETGPVPPTPTPTPSSTPPATVVTPTPTPTPTATAIAKAATSTKMLPSTGFEATNWFTIGAIALALGIGLTIVARAIRSRSRKTHE